MNRQSPQLLRHNPAAFSSRCTEATGCQRRHLLGVDELDQSPGDGGLRGKKFALDAADVCAHTACGDDEAVADGDPRQLSVVERRECVLSFSFLTLRGTHRLRPQAH